MTVPTATFGRSPQQAAREEESPPQGCARLPQQAAREDDKRREPRLPGRSLGAISARVRGGHEIVLIDVSASGALIEGARPLRPGARVELHVAIESRRVVLPARVARCLVAAIDRDRGVTYHAALLFERRFEWSCEADTLLVSSMHEACAV